MHLLTCKYIKGCLTLLRTNPDFCSHRQLHSRMPACAITGAHTYTYKALLWYFQPPVQLFPNDLIRLAPDCYLLQPRYLFSNLARGKIAPAWWLIFRGDILPHWAAVLRVHCCWIDRGSSCRGAIRAKWSPLTWFTDGSLHIVSSVDRTHWKVRDMNGGAVVAWTKCVQT